MPRNRSIQWAIATEKDAKNPQILEQYDNTEMPKQIRDEYLARGFFVMRMDISTNSRDAKIDVYPPEGTSVNANIEMRLH